MMEPTQRLDCGSLSSPDGDESVEDAIASKVLGVLTLVEAPSSTAEEDETGGNVTEFDIYGGENNIGRDPEQCRITFNNKSLSRLHAIIEVEPDGGVTLRDNNSLNYTWRNGFKLKPDVRYALDDCDLIQFGDVRTKFQICDRNHRQPDDAKQDGFFVPETPQKMANFVPGSQSSPVSGNFKVPESPAVTSGFESSLYANLSGDQSKLNDTSFVAPSQTVAAGPRSTMVVRSSPMTVGQDTMDLLGMETQEQATAASVGQSFDRTTTDLLKLPSATSVDEVAISEADGDPVPDANEEERSRRSSLAAVDTTNSLLLPEEESRPTVAMAPTDAIEQPEKVVLDLKAGPGPENGEGEDESGKDVETAAASAAAAAAVSGESNDVDENPNDVSNDSLGSEDLLADCKQVLADDERDEVKKEEARVAESDDEEYVEHYECATQLFNLSQVAGGPVPKPGDEDSCDLIASSQDESGSERTEFFRDSETLTSDDAVPEQRRPSSGGGGGEEMEDDSDNLLVSTQAMLLDDKFDDRETEDENPTAAVVIKSRKASTKPSGRRAESWETIESTDRLEKKLDADVELEVDGKVTPIVPLRRSGRQTKPSFKALASLPLRKSPARKKATVVVKSEPPPPPPPAVDKQDLQLLTSGERKAKTWKPAKRTVASKMDKTKHDLEQPADKRVRKKESERRRDEMKGCEAANSNDKKTLVEKNVVVLLGQKGLRRSRRGKSTFEEGDEKTSPWNDEKVQETSGFEEAKRESKRKVSNVSKRKLLEDCAATFQPRRSTRKSSRGESITNSVQVDERRAEKPSSKRKQSTKSVVEESLSALGVVDASSSGSRGGFSARKRSTVPPRVTFTGYEDPKGEKAVREMGGEISNDCRDCTVVVADKVRRTTKLMCALGRGVPIVSPSWISGTKFTKTFPDPWRHIVRDAESEKKWGFDLKRSLLAASRSPLLAGCKFHATKSCTPSLDQLRLMVECAGGSWLKTMPGKASDDVVVISCHRDRVTYVNALKRGIKVHDEEILLTGLLRQKLDFDAHLLTA